MKLTPIRSCFALNAALKKYNQRAYLKLSQKSLWILYAIYQIRKSFGCTGNEIFEFLRARARMSNRKLINTILKQLEEGHLVERTQTNPVKYQISISGVNTLNQICDTLRKRDNITKRKKSVKFKKR